MSLRTRLVLGLVLLLTAGLAVGNLATHRALESFLRHRVDEQLAQAQVSAGEVLARASQQAYPVGRAEIPGVTYAELRPVRGTTVRYVTRGVPEPDVDGFAGSGYATVGSEVSGPRYRVLVATGNSGTLLVAQSLADVDSTLRRLLIVELVVSGLVLAGVFGLALAVVRVGLRPLVDMTETADAIAAGDLGQRVPESKGDTEVGRLGGALNSMLGRIEDAFAERQASEDRLRRFVADASHELRTPLTSIRGYAELFRRGASDRPEDLATSMRRIEEESSRMGGLVDDMLLLARLDQHRPLDIKPVDLIRVAEDAAADLRATDPHRPVTVAASPVTIPGDEARLRQVLANLLANVRQHTGPETAVEVRVGPVGDMARIEVADAGPGIPAEQAGPVFERFYRIDKARARADGGAGLGLSIVAAVAAAHGGTVEIVAPAPGRNPPGTTVRIDLPLDGPGRARPDVQ